jgi:hypothetical protein
LGGWRINTGDLLVYAGPAEMPQQDPIDAAALTDAAAAIPTACCVSAPGCTTSMGNQS